MASDSQAAPQLCSGCTHPTQTGTRHAARMQSMLEDAGAAPGSLPGLGCRGRGAQVAPGPAPVHQEVRADSGGWTAGAQGQARPWGTGLRRSSSSQHSSACGGAGQEGRPVVLQGAGGVLPSRKLWVAEPGRTHPGLNSTAARAWDSPAGQVPSLAAPGTFSWPQGPCGLSRPCCHMWTSWEPGLWAQRTPGQTLALPQSCWVTRASPSASSSVRQSTLLFVFVGFPALQTLISSYHVPNVARGSGAGSVPHGFVASWLPAVGIFLVP